MNHDPHKSSNPLLLAVGAASVFAALVVGGSYFVSHKMNKAADTHASSAGRSVDPAPNLRQTLPSPSTSGQNRDSAVPPAR
jgi:hypothetical protein